MVHIRPGRTMQNSEVESFHGRVREVCRPLTLIGRYLRRNEAKGRLQSKRGTIHSETHD
jgi:hypothetical protein